MFSLIGFIHEFFFFQRGLRAVLRMFSVVGFKRVIFMNFFQRVLRAILDKASSWLCSCRSSVPVGHSARWTTALCGEAG